MAYANALAYAEHATDVKTDAVVWAANNLLRRDWNIIDGIDYHTQTQDRLKKLIAKLSAAGQKTDSLKMALAEQTQRDLVIDAQLAGPGRSRPDRGRTGRFRLFLHEQANHRRRHPAAATFWSKATTAPRSTPRRSRSRAATPSP